MNPDYGESRDPTRIQTKVTVVDNPRKKKNDSRISALETQNKDLNDKTTQILETLSAQGQSAPDPQNTNESNRTNPNLVRIHRPPNQNQN